MEAHDNYLRTLILYRLNIVYDLLLPSHAVCQNIDSHKTNLDSLDLLYSNAIIPKSGKSCIFQILNCIGIALFP